jgi:sortase A
MVLKWLGRSLIAAGVLILLFVAYQLFGTNVIAGQNQRALEAELEQALATPVTSPTPVPSPPPDAGPSPTPAPSPSAPPAAPPKAGDGLGFIEAPTIGLRAAVVEGVGVRDLRKGPGHLPRSPLPGEQGNVVISGHRTTYGAPFSRLDELAAGDPIRLVTPRGTFEYTVSSKRTVAPTEVSVIAPTDDARLTLTTCHPRYSARQRLIVVASLVTPAAQVPAA